ncbi:MAG: D-amino-acid dehydrogenase [Halioglobus sp.]|jgi:D-amino-acid dehydrogenase
MELLLEDCLEKAARLTSGRWIAQILKNAGINILLQDGKGYSITTDKPKQRTRTPTILSEAEVDITPMGDSLRIEGTLELSGLSQRVNRSRV